MDNEERYRRVLEEFGKFSRETQAYRARTEAAMAELGEKLVTYWGATASGMRQLADWFAETEDRASRERDTERTKRDKRDRLIIILLLISIGILGVALGILLWEFR